MENRLLKWICVTLLALPVGVSAFQVTATITSHKTKQEQGTFTDKQRRTPAQQKIDSQLLMALRHEEQGLANSGNDVVYDSAGRVAVDISAEVTDNLLVVINDEGGEVLNSYPQFKSVRAYLKLSSLETIAGLSEVRTISRAAKAELSGIRAPEVRQQSQSKPNNVTKPKATDNASPGKSRRKKRRRHRATQSGSYLMSPMHTIGVERPRMFPTMT